jgi:hypothetical protein
LLRSNIRLPIRLLQSLLLALKGMFSISPKQSKEREALAAEPSNKAIH